MTLKNKKTFKFLSILAIVLSTISLSGCSCFDPKSKEFSAENNELTITLTEDFEQSGSLESTSSFTTGLKFTKKDNTVLVQIFKYDYFSGFEEANLTEFAKIVTSANLNYDKENKLAYTDEYTSNNIYIKTFVFKTTSAYYEVDFRYVESGDDRIFDWANSIKFSQDIVYDIDETITDTKNIVLDTQDSASINIGASYIELEGEDQIYQKILLTGQVYRTQVEFSKVAKSSAYASLSDFANSLGYTNRNLTNKDYISLSGSSYVLGVGSCDIIIYCFESHNNYYTAEFISNNSNLDLFDSYADTFSAN